eukprot:762463-Prymnesium_polylepis.3
MRATSCVHCSAARARRGGVSPQGLTVWLRGGTGAVPTAARALGAPLWRARRGRGEEAMSIL